MHPLSLIDEENEDNSNISKLRKLK
jgi:hypothetical protein